MTTMTTGRLIAAVGDDGLRPVVWGLGATEEEARADAKRWLAEAGASSTLEYHPVSPAQAAAIRAGEVAWPIVAAPVLGVTDEQIEALRNEASAHGDFAQVAICDRALGAEEPATESGNRDDYLRGWRKAATQEAARRECARVIEDAAAMQE